jgi:hypothetical protein
MAASDEGDDEAREAREARTSARAGSGKRLTRRVVFLCILNVAVLYLCALGRGENGPKSWHPPLSVTALYNTLVKGYSVSAGLLDIACLTALHALYSAVVLALATPADRRRAALAHVRLAGKRTSHKQFHSPFF